MTSESKDGEQQRATQESVMGEAEVQGRPPADVEQLRAEIEQSRAELGETVEALVQKTDVKGQFQEKVAERKQRLRSAQEQAKQRMASMGRQASERRTPLVTAGAVLIVGLVVVWLLRRE
jgi:Flp pilus assembly protein TadB